MGRCSFSCLLGKGFQSLALLGVLALGAGQAYALVTLEDNKLNGVVQPSSSTTQITYGNTAKGYYIANVYHPGGDQEHMWLIGDGVGLLGDSLKISAKDLNWDVVTQLGWLDLDNNFRTADLTVNALQLVGTFTPSGDASVDFIINPGSVLTSPTVSVEGIGSLTLGTDEGYSASTGTFNTKVVGDVTLQNGTQVALVGDIYPGSKVYSTLLKTYGGSQAIPNIIVGDLTLTQGTYVSGLYNGGNFVPAYLKVDGNVAFAADSSMFMFGVADNMLQGNGVDSTLTIADGSQLYVAAAKVNKDGYSILSGFNDVTGVDPNAWVGENLKSVPIYKVAGKWEGDKYILSVNLNDIKKLAPALGQSFADLIDSFYTQGGTNRPTLDFLNIAMTNLTPEALTKVIESVMRLAQVAGTQETTANALQALYVNTATRLNGGSVVAGVQTTAMRMDNGVMSLDQGLSAGSTYQNGMALWITPTFNFSNTYGIKAGAYKTGSNTNTGGFALGADYTIDNKFRFGASLNMGWGNSRSTGGLSEVRNTLSYWGLSLYGGYAVDNLTLSADIGYTASNNSVKQHLPAAMGLADNRAKVHGDAIGMGIKAEYRFQTAAADITPYAGVRYHNVRTGKYSVKNNEGTLFTVDSARQNLVLFPLGLTISKDIVNAGSWTVSPRLSLGVILAAGDVNMKSRTRIPGLNGSAESKIRVTDTATFEGALGIEFKQDSLSFGLNYNAQVSQHRNAHGINASFQYRF